MRRKIEQHLDRLVSGTHEDSLQRKQIGQGALWTVKELAQHLRISERWIHERTRRDEIPCHRLGTALRFDPNEVQVWLVQRRTSLSNRGVA